ncbi:histidine kinase [Streptomyces xanthophaeus]|uniref:histidine kinase n=1 Tax=Streptomyces xanthophaeus TaxID=67385 RepID=UPI0026496BD8|nr:histidine kinase [Streptomyces xanthophaeus]
MPVVILVPEWLAWVTRFVLTPLAAAVLPWCAGRFLRQYGELLGAGLEREQRLLAEQTRLRERTRIAQGMHDLLGHELSLVALSAGALQLAPASRRPTAPPRGTSGPGREPPWTGWAR